MKEKEEINKRFSILVVLVIIISLSYIIIRHYPFPSLPFKTLLNHWLIDAGLIFIMLISIKFLIDNRHPNYYLILDILISFTLNPDGFAGIMWEVGDAIRGLG